MNGNIYINCAYEDIDRARALAERLAGLDIHAVCGGESEEKIAASAFVLNLCSEKSRTSKTFRKGMNYALKHQLDMITIHIGEQGIRTDMESMFWTAAQLFRLSCRENAAQAETAVQEQAGTANRAEIGAVGPAAPAVSGPQTPADQEEAQPEEKVREEAGETLPAGAETAQGKEEADLPIRASQQGRNKSEQEKLSERESLYLEGKRWLSGENGQADSRKAFALFRQAANQGFIKAQYQMSICYDEGIGVRRDVTEAARWLEMAAYGGDPAAQSEIGYCYEIGQGVPRNIREAVRWYAIASEQGNAQAKNNLAYCYQKGRGVTKDVKEAIRLYTEAAEAGDASAQYNLGYCYWYGEGIKTDKQKAIGLFSRSAAQGNAKAEQMVKILGQYSYVKRP